MSESLRSVQGQVQQAFRDGKLGFFSVVDIDVEATVGGGASGVSRRKRLDFVTLPCSSFVCDLD